MSTNGGPSERWCHDCGSRDLLVAPGYAELQRVTSDCKPWPPGGVLARCNSCGLVSTVPTAGWRADAEVIYRGYTIYHQSGGAEQPVFDPASGAARARSTAILHALRTQVPLPAQGRLLDVGCGNGAFLKACQAALPGWALCGSEVNDQHRTAVEAIAGVERLWTVAPAMIPGQFDLVSLVHVLEHIPGPSAFLRTLLSKIRPGGLLLLQVPDCRQNPFMLVVADHCSHFSVQTLAGVAARSGFALVEATDQWVAKELSLVARRPEGIAPLSSPSMPAGSDERAAGRDAPPASAPLAPAADPVFIGWETLARLLIKVRPLADRAPFGIFGTSIAATWLDSETESRATFFVDEDPGRVGRRHQGRPILGVAAIPDRAHVIVPLPPVLAEHVVRRLHSARPTLEITAA